MAGRSRVGPWPPVAAGAGAAARVPGIASDPSSVVLTTRVDRHGDVAVVVAEGDLDVATAGRLVDEVERLNWNGDRGPVVLDLAGVGFMDSSGLRALLDSERAVTDAGRTFALACLSSGVRRVLELVDLIGQLTVLEDLSPQALARIAEG